MKKRFAAIAIALLTLLVFPRAGLAQCTSNAHCRDGRVCKAGACTAPGPAKCTRDIDCPEPLTCDAGACQSAAPPRPPPTGPPYNATSTAGAGAPMRTERESIKGLWVAGISVLGGIWAIGIPVTIAIDLQTDGDLDEPSGYMAIPLVGPWLAIGIQSEDANRSKYNPAFAVSGALQAAGLAMIIIGASVERDVVVPAYAMGGAAPTTTRLRLAPAPIGERGLGLMLALE